MLTRRPRAVFFDAGNTLICLDLTAISSMLKDGGADVPREALARAEYHGRRAINAAVTGVNPGNDKGRAFTYFASILNGAGIEDERIPALFDRIRAANDEAVLWRIVPPGVHATLERLRAEGVKVGVISNADGRVEAQLAACDLTAHLDFVIDSHRVGVEKPDPRIFQMGLERTGVAPEDALYVGDMYEIDVVGARAVGIPGVLVDPLMLESVDCPRIRTVTELPELFPAG